MEDLPVEVVGNILSKLRRARDSIIASATCKKWRKAWCSHLLTLSFDYNDWSGYHDLSTSRLEILITQTIFQTTGLQNLSITMDEVEEFSAASVMAWLMYTRDSLRQLHYNVNTTPIFNIIVEKCGRQKLEVLVLAHNSISGIEPKYHKFPCLKSLSLNHVTVSASDLSLLLTTCPKLEKLSLICLDITMSETKLSSSSLKDIYIEATSLDKFVLEADMLEVIHLKDCTLEIFEVVCNRILRVIRIDDVSVIHFKIDDEHMENLETVDICNFVITWHKLYRVISRSSRLRKLRLWGVVFEVDDDESSLVDLDAILVCFPLLTHLSLCYDSKDGVLVHYIMQSFQGSSSRFMNVSVLEIGWCVVNELFSEWMEKLLERCPNLKKLIICGVVSGLKNLEECQALANFTFTIVQLMRKYVHVQVQFEFE